VSQLRCLETSHRPGRRDRAPLQGGAQCSHLVGLSPRASVVWPSIQTELCSTYIKPSASISDMTLKDVKGVMTDRVSCHDVGDLDDALNRLTRLYGLDDGGEPLRVRRGGLVAVRVIGGQGPVDTELALGRGGHPRWHGLISSAGTDVSTKAPRWRPGCRTGVEKGPSPAGLLGGGRLVAPRRGAVASGRGGEPVPVVAQRVQQVPLPEPGVLTSLEGRAEPVPVGGIGDGGAADAGKVEYPRVHDDVSLRGGLGQGVVAAQGEDEASLDVFSAGGILRVRQETGNWQGRLLTRKSLSRSHVYSWKDRNT
jgi:hypothetical protein